MATQRLAGSGISWHILINPAIHGIAGHRRALPARANAQRERLQSTSARLSIGMLACSRTRNRL